MANWLRARANCWLVQDAQDLSCGGYGVDLVDLDGRLAPGSSRSLP